MQHRLTFFLNSAARKQLEPATALSQNWTWAADQSATCGLLILDQTLYGACVKVMGLSASSDLNMSCTTLTKI